MVGMTDDGGKTSSPRYNATYASNGTILISRVFMNITLDSNILTNTTTPLLGLSKGVTDPKIFQVSFKTYESPNTPLTLDLRGAPGHQVLGVCTVDLSAGIAVTFGVTPTGGDCFENSPINLVFTLQLPTSPPSPSVFFLTPISNTISQSAVDACHAYFGDFYRFSVVYAVSGVKTVSDSTGPAATLTLSDIFAVSGKVHYICNLIDGESTITYTPYPGLTSPLTITSNCGEYIPISADSECSVFMETFSVLDKVNKVTYSGPAVCPASQLRQIKTQGPGCDSMPPMPGTWSTTVELMSADPPVGGNTGSKYFMFLVQPEFTPTDDNYLAATVIRYPVTPDTSFSAMNTVPSYDMQVVYDDPLAYYVPPSDTPQCNTILSVSTTANIRAIGPYPIRETATMTFYFYDTCGSLVKTNPPSVVAQFFDSATTASSDPRNTFLYNEIEAEAPPIPGATTGIGFASACASSTVVMPYTNMPVCISRINNSFVATVVPVALPVLNDNIDSSDIVIENNLSMQIEVWAKFVKSKSAASTPVAWNTLEPYSMAFIDISSTKSWFIRTIDGAYGIELSSTLQNSTTVITTAMGIQCIINAGFPVSSTISCFQVTLCSYVPLGILPTDTALSALPLYTDCVGVTVINLNTSSVRVTIGSTVSSPPLKLAGQPFPLLLGCTPNNVTATYYSAYYSSSPSVFACATTLALLSDIVVVMGAATDKGTALGALVSSSRAHNTVLYALLPQTPGDMTALDVSQHPMLTVYILDQARYLEYVLDPPTPVSPVAGYTVTFEAVGGPENAIVQLPNTTIQTFNDGDTVIVSYAAAVVAVWNVATIFSNVLNAEMVLATVAEADPSTGTPAQATLKLYAFCPFYFVLNDTTPTTSVYTSVVISKTVVGGNQSPVKSNTTTLASNAVTDVVIPAYNSPQTSFTFVLNYVDTGISPCVVNVAESDLYSASSDESFVQNYPFLRRVLVPSGVSASVAISVISPLTPYVCPAQAPTQAPAQAPTQAPSSRGLPVHLIIIISLAAFIVCAIVITAVLVKRNQKIASLQ